jgi:elongation factor P
MATTSDIKNGMCLELNGDTFMVVYFQHVKPGKGNAFVRTKLKNLSNGRVIEHTFQAGHKVDDVRVERRTYQYLYTDGDRLFLMNNDTYEQLDLAKDEVSGVEFLKEGNPVEVIFHAEKEVPLTCQLPQFVQLEITYLEPGLKGDTATNTLTPAVVETGANVRVPLFIKLGDIIKIDTTTGEYIERIKKD